MAIQEKYRCCGSRGPFVSSPLPNNRNKMIKMTGCSSEQRDSPSSLFTEGGGA